MGKKIFAPMKGEITKTFAATRARAKAMFAVRRGPFKNVKRDTPNKAMTDAIETIL